MTADRMCVRMTPEQFTRVYELNCRVPIALTEHLLTKGALRKGSRVVHMSSISGIAGKAGGSDSRRVIFV